MDRQERKLQDIKDAKKVFIYSLVVTLLIGIALATIDWQFKDIEHTFPNWLISITDSILPSMIVLSITFTIQNIIQMLKEDTKSFDKNLITFIVIFLVVVYYIFYKIYYNLPFFIISGIIIISLIVMNVLSFLEVYGLSKKNNNKKLSGKYYS